MLTFLEAFDTTLATLSCRSFSYQAIEHNFISCSDFIQKSSIESLFSAFETLKINFT